MLERLREIISRREITPELIEGVTKWGRSKKLLRKLRKSELLAAKVNAELAQARKVDPASLREPIGATTRRI